MKQKMPLAGLLLLLCMSCSEELPPRLMSIGDFALTAQNNTAFGSAQLRGNVWIGNLMFTSCPTVCPMLSVQVANLQRRMNDPRLHFVSISIDPEVDTPERLATYAAQYNADPARWHFLTGNAQVIQSTVRETFHLPLGARESDGTSYDIPHSERFILVDGDGYLRGIYRNNQSGINDLSRDARVLLAADAT